MGLAIIAALLFGIGSNPAIEQNVEIAWTDSFIDATDPGIKLLLRGKMAAGNSKVHRGYRRAPYLRAGQDSVP